MSKSILKFFSTRFRLSLLLLCIIYAVGIATILAGFAEPLMQLTPFNLLFASAILLYNAEGLGKRYLIWFLVVAIAGFMLEWIGTLTGIIFGDYSYGAALGIKLFDVPLIIGLNWAILVFATAAVFDKFYGPSWLKAAAAASLMVVYDILLEPIAMRFDFWNWAGGSIPLQNYIAWWVIAYLMLLGAFYFVENRKNRIAIYIIGVQTLFFIVLHLTGM